MIRYLPFASVISLAVLTSLWGPLYLSLPLLLLTGLGIWDLVQQEHSLFRNYPIAGHIRNLAESIRPQIHQYFIESDTEGRPFDREQRALVYQRAKNTVDSLPFGTERNVTASGYEWLTHSIAPSELSQADMRIQIGNDQCRHKHDSSLLNISAMSFGALSAAAIRALNKGAHTGGFAHDTGEGSLSPYHLEHGGDVIWEIGTGYFGCRTKDGRFDSGAFKEKAAHPQVKMLEVKLSQGAKPGHGGILPGAKVSAEIATTRGVPLGQDCISPPQHSAFNTPIELLEFLQSLRELGNGKPVGFKLCIGRRSEFLGICKAMRETEIYPDFVVIDGKEGGTGAAPPEFVDHVGTPLRDGLTFAHNALLGSGVREHVQLGASGKVVSGFDMAMCLALGANWCNSARGFMLALGCLQSQKCHTNRCPVGIATQDARRQKALVVDEKYQRVANFHRHTVDALRELAAAAGLRSAQDFSVQDFYRRDEAGDGRELQISLQLSADQLLSDDAPELWKTAWSAASPQSF